MSIAAYACVWALAVTVAGIACLAVALRCWVRQAGRKPTEPNWENKP
jgi:hypothetical protein